MYKFDGRWKPGESDKMIRYSIEYNMIIRDIFIEHQKKLNRDRVKRKENCIEKFEYYKDEPLSKDEIELASISKKWAGIGKELFTSADNYILSVNENVEKDSALRPLIISAVLCIDFLLKDN